MHLTKIAAYGAGDLLTSTVLLYGIALTPATLAGAWLGKKIVGRISDRVFVSFVEIGLTAAAECDPGETATQRENRRAQPVRNAHGADGNLPPTAR